MTQDYNIEELNNIIDKSDRRIAHLEKVNAELLEALKLVLDMDNKSPLSTSIFTSYQSNHIKSLIAKSL